MKKYTFTAFIMCAFLLCGTAAFLRGAYLQLGNEYAESGLSLSTLGEIHESIKKKDGEYISGKTYIAYFNGACQGVMGKKCVQDPGYTVAKLDNGYLAFAIFKDDAYEVDYSWHVEKLERLKGQLDEHGIRLTFSNVVERNPLYDTKLPYDCLTVDQHINGLIYMLDEVGINTVDMMRAVQDPAIDHYSLFYGTDHHWNVYGGFLGATCLIDELGYDTDEKITDISQYTAETVQDCFLGSFGRRVGPIYGGLDDFAVLYPNFDTDLTVTTGGEVREGTFGESVIYKNWIPTQGTVSTVAYSAFLGGDNGLQIVKNNLCTNGKRVLLIRNSYGAAASPYLALACEELHIIDMRYYDGAPIAEYAREMGADDVVIMYSNGSLNNTCFNFDME